MIRKFDTDQILLIWHIHFHLFRYIPFPIITMLHHFFFPIHRRNCPHVFSYQFPGFFPFNITYQIKSKIRSIMESILVNLKHPVIIHHGIIIGILFPKTRRLYPSNRRQHCADRIICRYARIFFIHLANGHKTIKKHTIKTRIFHCQIK